MGPWASQGMALPIPGSTREEAMVDYETSLTVEPRPQGPWPPAGGGIHSREARSIFPPVPLRVGPPRCSGTVRGSRRAFWENSILDSRVVFTRLLVYMATCFFSDDVLWRNHLIERVELFELSSIHGTISRESTFHLYFVKVESGFSRND